MPRNSKCLKYGVNKRFRLFRALAILNSIIDSTSCNTVQTFTFVLLTHTFNVKIVTIICTFALQLIRSNANKTITGEITIPWNVSAHFVHSCGFAHVYFDGSQGQILNSDANVNVQTRYLTFYLYIYTCIYLHVSPIYRTLTVIEQLTLR